MAYHTTNGYIISEKNDKMGNIPSFSLLPIITCPDNVPCAKKCYAHKMCKMRPTVYNSYNTNYENLVNRGSGRSRLEVDIIEYIRKYEPRYFRWNVAGDLYDISYFYSIVTIAESCPETDFLVFTKQYDIAWKGYLVTSIPKNLHVYMSVWGDYKPAEYINLKRFHIAYYQDKKNKIQIDDKDAKICGGKCPDCKDKWCFKGRGNVVFLEH